MQQPFCFLRGPYATQQLSSFNTTWWPQILIQPIATRFKTINGPHALTQMLEKHLEATKFFSFQTLGKGTFKNQ